MLDYYVIDVWFCKDFYLWEQKTTHVISKTKFFFPNICIGSLKGLTCDIGKWSTYIETIACLNTVRVCSVGWLVVLGLTALWDNISVYIGPSPKERENKGERIDESKNVQTTPPAPTASALGPCPTVIQIVGRPGTGSLPSTIAQPDHPLFAQYMHKYMYLHRSRVVGNARLWSR